MTKTVIKYENGERVSTEELEAQPQPKLVKIESESLAELAKSYDPKQPDKEKRDKFLRLATKRTQVVLDKIRVLNNCARRGQYDWSKDDAIKIIDILRSAIVSLQEDLDRPKGEHRKKFSF